jgi:hypothetical protein
VSQIFGQAENWNPMDGKNFERLFKTRSMEFTATPVGSITEKNF